MKTFQKLFAIDPRDIRQDVIITPFLNLEYFSQDNKNKISRGFLFEVLNGEFFSVIKTGIGASFVGDAVMYLKQTKAKRVYFIGSCGAVSNLEIGDLGLVDKALNLESFSNILNKDISHSFIDSRNNLYRRFLQSNNNVKRLNLASVGSLSLQENILPLLKKCDVNIVDMEASSFLCASKFLRFSNLALLYVTDIILTKPFYRDLTNRERTVIQQARQKAISLICDFIHRQNA